MSDDKGGRHFFGGHKLYDLDDEPMKQRPSNGLHAKPTDAPQAEKQDDEENNHQQQEQMPQDFMTMKEKVSMAIPEWSAEPPTICEVPEDLTEGNKGAYIPKVVCIGPLFDSKRKTASKIRLEHYKWCCVRKLIVGRRPAGTLESAAWSREVHEPLLRKCFDTMMRLVPQIRASYSSISSSNDTNGSGGMSNDEQLAIKMLLDGCFVLHRLLKRSSGEGNGGNYDDDWNQQFGRCWVWGTVKRDLLLLSNQVPFFVLRKLFKHLRSNTGERDDILINNGLQLFSSLNPRPLHSAPIDCHKVHHLLHLFYLSIDFPPSSSPDDPYESTHRYATLQPELTQWVPCAKELEEAGIQFRARKHGAVSFLNVRFHRGILEIPPLELFDYSEPLFRNLIAFEQTYPATPGRITAYAIFMDCLLKTTEDVRLLHRSGVLVNHMNGERDSAMGFFSRLCAEAHTSANRNYLAGVMEEVVRYQGESWHRWRAALVSNYFPNPWVIMSVVAATVLLILTVLQSFYSVYSYYKPTK